MQYLEFTLTSVALYWCQLLFLFPDIKKKDAVWINIIIFFLDFALFNVVWSRVLINILNINKLSLCLNDTN
jgi:hypothetical protein